MTAPDDIAGLLDSLRNTGAGELTSSLCVGWARRLAVDDLTVSFVGLTDRLILCASSDDARTLDEWQYTLDEGPAFDAAATDHPVVAATTKPRETPWPRISAKALALGYQVIAAVPVRLVGRTFGTLSLHHRERDLPSSALHTAVWFGHKLAGAMASRPGWAPSLFGDSTGHDVVHQATGMVVAQRGISAAAAVTVLRDYASSHDRLLLQVAGDVVSRLLDFTVPVS